MSTTRWIIESACAECGRFHLEAMLKPGGDPNSSIAYCYTRGSRIVVDPDNLPPDRMERAARAWATHERDDWNSLNMTHRYQLAATAEVIIRAFLSDPEPGDQT